MGIFVVNNFSKARVMLEGFVFKHEDGEENHIQPMYLQSGKNSEEVDSEWQAEIEGMAVDDTRSGKNSEEEADLECQDDNQAVVVAEQLPDMASADLEAVDKPEV
eukprot:TRINITY_DN82450_c0_g1_i1.p2 TRINITY_DN82450_c0_g1~~TRINITY_DN82450_c0_g1_i1.p2  ORF type:complete len:105 (-),score=37.72 TRINITY_DN82450_c0_g1_i1:48-362(-)